jgi:transposase
MPRLTDVDKGKIICLHDLGWSNSRISRELGYHKSTVAKWVGRWVATGSVVCLKSPGRPRKTTPQQDAQILQTSQNDHFATSRRIKDTLVLDISRKTIIRRLKEAGIFARVAAKKEIIKEYQRAQRLAFALDNVNQPPEYWRKVVFTDEKVFSSVPSGRFIVYRPRRRRHDPEFVKNATHSGRFSVTVWGWISYEGVGMLWEIDGRLTGIQYRAILRDIMVPSVTARFEDGDFIFMHDRSPIHTSRVARAWIQEQGIRVIDWPPKGCDMNPIENVWAEMVRFLNEHPNPPLNRDALSERIREAWEDLMNTPGYIRKLIDSMPNRLAEVIEHNGMFSSF